MNEIIIYQSPENQTTIEVQFDGTTVWLNQTQISELFQRDRTVITKHIGNVFSEGELDEKSNVQKMHVPNSDKPVVYYNLDVIISVGYRVKSKRGTQFRIWASQILKNYLLQGYALNEKKLREQQTRLTELEKTLALIQESVTFDELRLQEARGMLEIIARYARTMVLLNQFDTGELANDPLNRNVTFEIQYPEAREVIDLLKTDLMEKKEASDLFGNERDESFRGILRSVVQTFGGEYLYPSIEEQAAHLLYFVIKNHPFSDGNKRIGALLFVWFLERNRHLHGFRKINENALVALALLIAQSDPAQKEIMVKLVINLINR